MRDYSGSNDSPEELQEQPEPVPVTLHSLKLDIDRIENKLDKLIESNKNLIAYFTTMHERDVRDVNYHIRSFSTSKSKFFPPMPFVPNHGK